MAKLLQMRRPAVRSGNLFRSWLAARLQKERRKRNAVVVIPAPAITGYSLAWNGGDGYADVTLNYTFNHTGLATATFEIWLAKASMSWIWGMLTTITSGSAGTYTHVHATQYDTLRYKMRYRNGAVLGPFGETMEIFVEMA
jgi:hypothetical protein